MIGIHPGLDELLREELRRKFLGLGLVATFRCAHCGREFRIPFDDVLEQRVRCPCGQTAATESERAKRWRRN